MFQLVESYHNPRQLAIFRRLFGFDKNWNELSQHMLQNGGMILTWGTAKLVTSCVGNTLVVHWITHRAAITRALVTDLASLALEHRMSFVQWRSDIHDLALVKIYANSGAALFAHDKTDFYWIVPTGLN